ncbi:MAG: sigma 54-interacting transcriptional regulator [Verrucomicrobiia bacterium]
MNKLLVIDDEPDVLYSFKRIFDSPEFEITSAQTGEEGVKIFQKKRPDAVIMDIRLGGENGLEILHRLKQIDSKVPVILMTAYGTTQTAIEAMKRGAFDYLLKPFDIQKLKQTIAEAFKATRYMKESVVLQPLLEKEDYELGIVGKSAAMQEVFKLIGQVAPTDATVLITGESGTGKELVARAIYHYSNRNNKPFLAINCAAIPENLLESELFGHEKGAFTGAFGQRIGKFEQCNGGTIFLDEIGEMSPATQSRILRVLQTGTFTRVGGNQEIKVDVRIIAATNKPLEEAVASKKFREDLFYRLNVVRIHLPPLRERREDIRFLVEYFLKKFSPGKTQKQITAEALQALEDCPWNGNVRELENVIRRAIVLSRGDTILLSDLPPETLSHLNRKEHSRPSQPLDSSSAQDISAVACGENNLQSVARFLFNYAKTNKDYKLLPAIEREFIILALKETSGNQVKAAKLLGITRATLRKRIDKYKIKKEIHLE